VIAVRSIDPQVLVDFQVALWHYLDLGAVAHAS